MKSTENVNMDEKEIDRILERTKCIQQEMHSLIEVIKKTKRGKNLRYDDMVIVFFSIKLAELQEKIENQFSIKLN